MANAAVQKPYRLLALGRLAGATRDVAGDTLGSFSGMALEPGSWRASGDAFAGTFLTLPDRGFNEPEKGRFSNYPARVHRVGFALRGMQLTLTYLDTRFLRDEVGGLTTGLDPERGTTKQFGLRLPSPKKGPGVGRISIDSEGLAVAADGCLFISDEFGANIYCCTADGRIVNVIAPPEAFVPRVDGDVCFSSADEIEVERGRAPNDGFEGLSLSGDGKQLYALLQSPLMQDRRGEATTQRYTRLLVHDVSKTRHKLASHYVVELPIFGDKAQARAAEANEIVALGHGRILVLTRESYGFGAKEANARMGIAWKRVMIGDLNGASNLAGSKYERKAKPVAPKGRLEDEIAAVSLSPFVDIADEEELNRVGLSAKTVRKGLQLLSAKWESLVLSPVLDPARPRERLLFIGNDNDFRTRAGFMPEREYDGAIEHDNMVLAYRVTLPA